MPIPSSRTLKIAALCSAYFPLSHADVIVSRWLCPRPTDAKWGWPACDGPRSEIASLYVAQFPSDDTSREVATRFEVPMFASIRDALTLGTSALAVDGVLLIVEHGDFPLNSRRQKLYPRFEWFQQIVEVFQDTGRVCPVWIDKALSWNPEQARQIVETAREMKIPLMAGSSLPHAGFSPPFNWQNENLEEVVALFYGGPEIYGFHSLELVHSLMQRCGGVQPVSSVEVLCGEEVWQAMDKGQWSRELFDNALGATRQQESGDVRYNCQPNPDLEAVLSQAHRRGGMTATTAELSPVSPLAWKVKRTAGTREVYVMLAGHLGTHCVAARSESGKVWAGEINSSGAQEFHPHFAIQNRAVEEFFVSGTPSIPLENALQSSVAIAAFMEALA
jgi:hypothetical protein